MTHMKNMAKETGIKGRNLFHPLRLALSGEMSGQDVTKQMSLLSMACGDNAIIDSEKAGVVDFAARMVRLKDFCDTIPEQYRAPPVKTEKIGENKDAKVNSSSGTASAKNSSDTTKSPSSSGADPMDGYEGPPISALDIRVGRITKVWEHPEADKLYCEEIDVGEDEPRQIASGLRPFMQPEDMEGRLVLVLCNLKARKLVGFSSHGMVLCASNSDHTDVKMVSVPVEAKVGERVTVPDMNFEGEEGAPYAENKIGKKKIFEGLAPFMVTSKYGVPEFLGRPFMTSAGVCTSPIADGSVA
jgi:aminoacyl tRNA synthase complex-interacting multifunctional protein 1